MTYWRQHFLGVELALAVAFTLAFGMWTWLAHSEGLIDHILGGQRSAVYGTVATLDGALLGFVIATTAIVLGFAQSDQFNLLRNSAHYRTLWRTFTSTIRSLGLATAIAIAALLVDRDGHPNSLLMVLCAGTTVLAALRVARAVWALEGTIRVVTRQDPRRPSGMQVESGDPGHLPA
jgi:hypothetical protein